MFLKRLALIFLLGVFLFPVCIAQVYNSTHSGEILQDLKKLNTVGSVLYIAAHPDDENTGLLTWFSQEKHWHTAYLSLTRGGGGQNLLGKEKGRELAVIRTQELLAARRLDGAEQYFTRAVDFGYSKSAEETLEKWGRDEILSDVVWVIRKFQPDIIITRFPSEGYKTHGHHLASAILAKEAFTAAADPNRFPEQLTYVSTWQAKRLLWNVSSWFFRGKEEQFDASKYYQLDIGGYNPLLGKSYGEIAAESRSQHKSQGMGRARQRGENIEYFEFIAGEKPEKDIFEGIDDSWGRYANTKIYLQDISQEINEIITGFDPSQPELSVESLLALKSRLLESNVRTTFETVNFLTGIIKQLDDIIANCSGMYFEAIADNSTICIGETIHANVNIIGRLSPIQFEGIANTRFNQNGSNFPVGKVGSLAQLDSIKQLGSLFNQNIQFNYNVNIDSVISISNPYWWKTSENNNQYQVANFQIIGQPENPPALEMFVYLLINVQPIIVSAPLSYKYTDPIKGEIYHDVHIVPKIMVSQQSDTYIFTDDKPKRISLTATAGTDNVNGILYPDLPGGWSSFPESAPFQLQEKGESFTADFLITPPREQASSRFMAKADADGQVYNREGMAIDYDHIPKQMIFPEAESKLVRIDLEKKGEQIGYVMGAGDEVPQALEEMGYIVTILDEEALRSNDLSKFDAILTGIRAYNVHEWLPQYQEKLLKYAENGGNLIIQYNSSWGLKFGNLGPYPFKVGRERVTVEEAPVEFLIPDHPLLIAPNKITKSDFEAWVQERGLYFASDISEEYKTIFSMHDPGEEPATGSLIIAKYGKGAFIYTGLSFFRQLPAGVPGAYRLLANMISYGK